MRTQKSLRSAQLINRALKATAALSLLGAVGLGAASYYELLPTSLPQDQLAEFSAAKDLIQEPGANLELPAPPSAPLDGQDSNSILQGFVGNSNDAQAPVTYSPDFSREEVLNDFAGRISDEFDIPKTLRTRVGFWFDIYTKYDENRRVIHHQDYPWVIFKVVDVSDIINSDKPRFRWMRNEKADKVVKKEVERVRATIAKLAKGASTKKLKADELEVANALLALNGNVQKAAKKSAGEVRVQTGQKNFFAEGLSVSPRYLKTMEKIFVDKKLPVELTRLPFVESSFNKHATSKVGATGIWQFMGNTGRKFMLVNDTIDERRSPFKASEGAARLLKENHMILGRNWALAITAWNHGPAGVRRASKAAGSKDLGTIVARYRSRSFDFASSNFYSEFLGALYAEKYNDLIFGPIEREAVLEPMIVKVARPVRTKDVLKASGMDSEEFLLMNADLKIALKKNTMIPVGFRLHVPDSSRVALERLVGARKNQRIASN